MVKRNFKAIGEYLRKKREKKGISQLEISQELGFTTSQFVSNWERGLAQPPMNSLRDVAEMLSIDKDELIELLLKIEKEYLKAVIYGQLGSSVKRAKKTNLRIFFRSLPYFFWL